MSIQNVKLIAFDMDGTLLNGDSQMSEETKQACRLLQQQGRKLVISTGRTYLSAKLPVDNFPFDGYVCSNGAAIYEQDGKLVDSTPLPAEVVLDTISRLRRKKIYYEVHDTASNRWMVLEDRELIEELLKETTSGEGLSLRRFSFYHLSKPVPERDLLSSISSGELSVVKVFVWHTKTDELQEVRDQLACWKDEATITSSGKTNFEVNAKGVSKATGLRYFFEKWGISLEQSAAFGDADNDLELLSTVGHPVAMDNATEQVKRIARYVAPNHRENGVAQFIRENFLANS